MKKGILINVEDQIFTWVDVEKYTDIYTHLKCHTFECVNLDGTDTVYVDEEGLLHLTPQSMFFTIGNSQPLCGNGLILGIDHETGESTDCNLSLEFVKSKVKFMDVYEVQMKSRLGVF
jgi:hypothetical protein